MRGLVVGRFQPLHKGHQQLIQQAIEDCVHVAVGVGSANARQTPRDPFTLDERLEMLQAVFGDHVEYLPLPDLHDPPRWARHVLELVGDVDKVFGNDPATVDLFEDLDVPVVRPGLVDRERYESTTIRLQMAEGDEAWRRAVPAPVEAILERLGASKRLRLLEAAL